MLRITVHDEPRTLTFQLEGSLAGPWVRVLEECWQSTVTGRRVRSLLLDLTGVTFIDAAGRACLAAMHRQGAEFVAADCLTKAVVAEITQTPGPRPRASEVTGSSRYRPTERGTSTWEAMFTRIRTPQSRHGRLLPGSCRWRRGMAFRRHRPMEPPIRTTRPRTRQPIPFPPSLHPRPGCHRTPGENGCCGRGPWPAWRSRDISWSPRWRRR